MTTYKVICLAVITVFLRIRFFLKGLSPSFDVKLSRKSSLGMFLKATEGVSAIQFAILAPVFITAVVSGVQVGIVLIIENALEGAAREASRFAIVDANEETAASILAVVVEKATTLSGGIIRPEHLSITVKSYDEISELGRPEPYEDSNGDGAYTLGEVYEDINNNGQWDADRGVSGSFGKPGAAVIYEIQYRYDTVIPIFHFNPIVNVTARTVVVNEDYIETAPSQAPSEQGSGNQSLIEWLWETVTSLTSNPGSAAGGITGAGQAGVLTMVVVVMLLEA